MTPREQILAKCKEVVEIAKEKYGIDMSRVRIGFDLKGRAAGKAHGLKYRDPVISNYVVKFNCDMMGREAFDHVLNATVPHEYAHIMCFIDPDLGKNHDYGWERVCLGLGGSGATRHQEDVVYGKGHTYEYLTNKGHKVRMGDRHHECLQRGQPINFRHGKGSVLPGTAYSIVGFQGRTLDKPVVRTGTAVTVPVQPVATVQRPAFVPVLAPRLQPLAPPVARAPFVPVAVVPGAGESKASISRRIMLQGYRAGHAYETIIAAMIAANGYDRQLARGTFKANQKKVGIPESFGK